MSKRIRQLEEQQNLDKKWRDKYVECKECGVLVRKNKATPEARLEVINILTIELVYYCQHCKPKKKAKK